MSGQNLELALKLKIAQSGLENIQNLIGELKSAGIATDGLEADAAQLAAELNSVDGATKQAAASTEKSTQAYSGAAKGVRSISEQLAEARTALLAYIGAQSAIGAAGNLTNLADEYKSLEARIKLAVGEQGNLKTAMDAVSQTALTTGQNLNTVGELYASLGRSTQASQEQIAALTDTIAKATALSGGSAESANAAITQLNQSLDSGVFRGDEFNSVMEQAPIIVGALAKSLGVTRGELRGMANDGTLTADVVTKALLDQKAAIDESFSKLPLTISRAAENVKTNFALMVGELDKTSGASATVAAAINGIADNLEAISRIAVEAGAILATAFAAKSVPAIIGFTKELVVATKAAGGLRAMMAAIPSSLVITAALVGGQLVIDQLLKIAELNSEAGKNAAAAQETARKQLQEFLSDQQAKITALEQYKNTVAVGSEEFGKMSDFERKQYELNIDAARRYNIALKLAAYAQKELGVTVTANAAEAQKALDQLALSQTAVDNQVSLGAQALIKQFDAATLAGQKTTDVLKGMAQSLDIGSAESIQAFGEALVELEQKGAISAAQVEQSWSQSLSKLSSEDLAAFAINAKAAFNSGERDAAALAEALNAQLSEAAKRVGVDLSAAMGGVSAPVKTALDNVNAFEQGLIATGKTAAQIQPAMELALGKAIDTAKTQADIDALKTKIHGYQQKGELAAASAARLNDQLLLQKQAVDAATPGVGNLAAGISKLIAGASGYAEIAGLRLQIQQMGRDNELTASQVNENLAALDKQAAALDKQTTSIKSNASAAGKAKKSALELQQEYNPLSNAALDATGNLDDMNQTLSDSEGIAQMVSSKIEAALDSIGALSKGAEAAARSIRTASGDWRDWASAVGGMDPKQFVNQDQALAGLNDQLAQFQESASQAADQIKYLNNDLNAAGLEWVGLNKGLASIYTFTQKLAEAKIEMTQFKLAQYDINESVKNGGLTLEEQARKLQQLKNQYSDLDSASLRDLQDQIDQVNGKLKAMQDQATATLQSLQEELANQQGDYATAAEIEAKQKILKLQQQIEEARTAGNAAAVESLQKALDIQAKLNATALAEAKAKEQQAKDANKTKTASSSSSTTTTTSSNSGGGASPVPAAAGAPPVNIHIGGVLDVNDRTTLDSLARKLQPVFTDLARRGAV